MFSSITTIRAYNSPVSVNTDIERPHTPPLGPAPAPARTQPPPYRPPMFSSYNSPVSVNTDIERPYTPPLGPVRTRPPPYRPPMFPVNHITQESLTSDEFDYVRRRITFEYIMDEEVEKVEVSNNFYGHLNLPKCDTNCECTICLSDDNTNNDMGKLPCGHTFHTNCITQWFQKNKTTCPNCRTVINFDTLLSK
jgi:hypothetical protein